MQRVRCLQSRCSSLLCPSPNPIDTRCDHRPPRSIYALTRKEIMRGIANRFVHSRTYILLYLVMAALSVTTVVLSLSDGCPGLAFYILEFIVNISMILEVGVRFIAFGRVSFTSTCWQSFKTKLELSNSGDHPTTYSISFSQCFAQSPFWY